MLCKLAVENYALISRLEIELRKGLTIITGETGAGKSILLGALSLILGKRADTSVLLDKDKKCIVEGTFGLGGYGLAGFFAENNIDYDDETIIRREIASNGKSRAFINDIPVNLELLTELGNRLIDVHSQHQNLNLASSSFQMKVIDSYAGAGRALSDYRSCFDSYRKTLKDYQDLSDEATRTRTELDYLVFQYNQLEDARLKAGEQEDLESEQEKLTHAGEIKGGLTSAAIFLQGDDQSVLGQLKESMASVSRISKYLHDLPPLINRIDSAYIEIKDIAREIDRLNDQMNFDPAHLDAVNERLNLIYDLLKKHRLSSIHELMALKNDLSEKISRITSYDQNLSELKKLLDQNFDQLSQAGKILTATRKKSIPDFEKRITSMLLEVGIPGAIFSVEMNPAGEFSWQGPDSVRFLFSANRNLTPQDISKVASGGELSRLMLCIKSLMSDSAGLPTIIFDEIDTGVSGDIAERVGNIIFRMSDRMQIINITHLPQVASKGNYHFLVYKFEEGKSTSTRMKLLDSKERIVEIAKMLSGEEVTPAALENARVLLGTSPPAPSPEGEGKNNIAIV